MDSVKDMEAASDSHGPGTTASVALNTTSSGRTGCGEPIDYEKGQQQTTITTAAAVTKTLPPHAGTECCHSVLCHFTSQDVL